MLWVMAAKNGYVCSRWMTYRQAQELGGQVRGGETSATVVKYGTFTRENELGVDEELPYARAYRVFNADQIEGWLKALKEDKRAIFRAASEAQKAADFVLPAAAKSEAAAA